MHSDLIEQLQHPACFDHPVTEFAVIETHISWVLLTGSYAYKFRKPVNFGFLDFTHLEQRRFDCEEELRLNQPLAASLYLGVVTVTRDHAGPHINGTGEAIEYAVKMYQFDQHQLLSQMQDDDIIHAELISQLAHTLANAHAQLPTAAANTGWGSPEWLSKVMQDNIDQVRSHGPCDDTLRLLKQVEAWTGQQLQAHRDLIDARRMAGLVRECHGDLHLGNIVLWQGQPTPFDCIEFNPHYRWVDLLNDLSFLLMDLEVRGKPDFAHLMLNDYLSVTGDYGGVPLLPMFKCYRAMVRAKVALLGDNSNWPLAQRYLTLAHSYQNPAKATLTLMHGVSGSGKSTQALQLAATERAIHLRSDIERKRLYPDSRLRYSPAANAQVYAHLLRMSRQLLTGNSSVIVDATFLHRSQRQPFIQLAQALGHPVQIVCCEVDESELEKRLSARLEHGQDPSEATIAVMQQQLREREPLTADEQALAVQADQGNGGSASSS